MDKLDIILSSIILGIAIGSFLTALSIGYSMNEKATKQETNNSVIYTYSWEVRKRKY